MDRPMEQLDDEQWADVDPDTLKHGEWMETFSGKRVYPFSPMNTKIDPIDIAHHLANENRYAGAAQYPYSVAQHSYLLWNYVRVHEGNPMMRKLALIHDAPEYIVKDMTRPIKHGLGEEYTSLEYRWKAAIYMAFKFPEKELSHGEVRRMKEYDLRISLDERAALLPNSTGGWAIDYLSPLNVRIEEWSWRRARVMFLAAWEQEFGLTADAKRILEQWSECD